MTVEIQTVPVAWTSARVSATVNGSPAGVIKWETFCRHGWSIYAAYGDALYHSALRFGADETTTVRITLLSGPITTATIYGRKASVTAEIQAGVLVLSVPTKARLRVELNGNRKEPVHVYATGLQPAIPAGSVAYNGFETILADNRKIHFPAGHTILPSPMLVGDNVTIHIDRNAIIDGQFVVGAAANKGVNLRVQGKGWFSRKNAVPDPETLAGADFPTMRQNCVFSTYISELYATNGSIEGPGFIACPTFQWDAGFSSCSDVDMIGYMRGGQSTMFSMRPSLTDGTALLEDCSNESGDDVVDLWPYCPITVRRVVAGTGLNGCFLLHYRGTPPGPWHEARVSDCDAYHMGAADTDSPDTYPERGSSTIVHCKIDWFETQRDWGRYDVEFDGLRVQGRIASRFMAFLNRPYPYSPAVASDQDNRRDGSGQINGIRFKNVSLEQVPEQISLIEGIDRESSPIDVAFENLTMAGELVRVHNWSDYFSINEFVRRLTFEGLPVVTITDLCNRALSLLGDAAILTSVFPSDGSQLSQIMAANYDAAVDTCLQWHAWSFAMRTVTMTAMTDSDRDEWDYRYQEPAAILKVLHVLPETTRQDIPDQCSVAGKDYSREYDSDEAPVIYTDIPNARLRYVKRITEPSVFPPMFQQALVRLLAHQVSGQVVRGNEGVQIGQRMLVEFDAWIRKAAAADGKNRSVEPLRVPGSVAARF